MGTLKGFPCPPATLRCQQSWQAPHAIGILWLLTGLAIMATGIGAFASWAGWRNTALALALASLVLCVLGLPGAKIGIPANLLLLAYLAAVRLGWLSQ